VSAEKGKCAVCGVLLENAMGRYICEKCFVEVDFAAWEGEADRATYDPDDDKLRIYSGRVPDALFAALDRLGYQRAYKQGCWYAKWSPAREDAAVDLCGEVTDEDSTVFERAQMRAERLAGYASNAARRSAEASAASARAVEGIPFGQPILVGHYSERMHRRAIERAQAAATRAYQESDRAEYWHDRAQAAATSQNVHFRPDVIKRRIKDLEAELRKHPAGPLDETAIWRNAARFYMRYVLLIPDAPVWGFDENLYNAQSDADRADIDAYAVAHVTVTVSNRERFRRHWEMQREYWLSFLQERGCDNLAERWPIERGHWVAIAGRGGGLAWAPVLRVNKALGRVASVSIDQQQLRGTTWRRVWQYEDLKVWVDRYPTPEEFAMTVPPAPVSLVDQIAEPSPAREFAESLTQGDLFTESE